MNELMIQRINLRDNIERQKIEDFLQKYELKLDEDVDYTVAALEEDRIKATCSKAGKVLKCFAVSKEIRGEGITATLISNMIDRMFEEGIYHSFIFTKPEKIDIFTSLNYKLIHKVQEAALLENGIYNIEDTLNDMATKYKIDNYTPKSSIVMNCNPFTLGHQYIIEEASRNCMELLVFIVQEDKSVFPFDMRYKLVLEGTSYLPNVKVIPAGEYIISSATFPSYFIKKEDERLKAYTELDAGIFCKYFCKKFNIKKRYVGEEPYCKVTNFYNDTLSRVLSENNVELIEIKRKKFNNEQISASIVRKMIKYDRMDVVKELVPQITWEFLNNSKGRESVEKIRFGKSPH